MKQVKNMLLEDIHDKIEGNMEQIMASLECKPLFGAVGGSISLNLANKSSDIDCYMITERVPDSLSEVKIVQIYCSDIKLDCMCVPIDELIRECEKYHTVNHHYPTRFYREQSEMNIIKRKKDVERPTFKREMVMRIYLADKIFEFEIGSAERSYHKLKSGLLLIDIWDAHFNRAYGNYYEKIKEQELVSLRKYLYTISELTLCHLIMEKKDKPVMNYKYMFTPGYCPYANNEIVGLCSKLWRDNCIQKAAKGKDYILAIPKLNQWIERQLGELVEEMRVKEEFLRNCFLPFKKF